MPVTVFLVVLIVALIFGNVFLSLLKPSIPPIPADFHPEIGENENNFETKERSKDFEDISRNEKLNYLNKRMNRLENLLLRVNNTQFLGKKLNGTKLFQKVNDLDEFRQNAKLEIAALKQEFAKIKKSNGEPEKEKKQEEDIDEEKIHRLIYHSKH